MKKLITMFSVFLLASFIFTSCGSTDAKENGTEAGELKCEWNKLDKERADLFKKTMKMDWDKDEDTREKMAEAMEDMNKLAKKMQGIANEIDELEMNAWTATEGKDDKKKWEDDFNKAKEEEEKKCEDKK